MLTARQREVLALVANGSTSQQASERLNIGVDTVNSIIGNAFRTLGVTSRAQAVAVALAVGELGIHQIHIPDQQQEPTS